MWCASYKKGKQKYKITLQTDIYKKQKIKRTQDKMLLKMPENWHTGESCLLGHNYCTEIQCVFFPVIEGQCFFQS